MTNQIIYRHFFSMGTRLDIVLPGLDEGFADELATTIKQRLDSIEDNISIYKENSVFSGLNRLAYRSPQEVSMEVFSLIEDLKILSVKTLGYFDFSIGKLSEWNKIFSHTHAGHATYEKLLADLGEKNILTESVSSTVSFLSDKVYIDSGGFGKGYGLDAIRKILDSHQVDSAFISFGESSILAQGRHPYGKSWKTGIRHIFRENESVYTFELGGDVLSVSGISPENMKKYGAGHVLNPLTGESVNAFRQAAVSGHCGLESEAISTALLCAPENVRDAIMDAFPDYKAVIIEYDDLYNPLIKYLRNEHNGSAI